jgi:hypothetical protein
MPVLPEVGSTIVPPGCRAPERSASSTIASAMRSLIEPPGLARSDLIQTCCASFATPAKSRPTRMCGVRPMVSRMLLAFMVVSPWKRNIAGGRRGRTIVAT